MAPQARSEIALPPAVEARLPLGVSLYKLEPEKASDLSKAYASTFWTGAWKELLLDEDGKQYGSIDPTTKKIYPETEEILRINNIKPNPGWVEYVWERAASGTLVDVKGRIINPYWTLEKAEKTLQTFVAPVSEGGYGGEIIVAKGPQGEFIGFAAYTVLPSTDGQSALNKRFPYTKLLTPDKASSFEALPTPPNQKLLGRFIGDQYPGLNIGIFLDLAVNPEWQDKKIGSSLFDVRLSQMVAEGAQVIVGRTTEDVPAQCSGNYLKRGMNIVARDPETPAKVICVVTPEMIIERPTR